VKRLGDGLMGAFADARSAIDAALEACARTEAIDLDGYRPRLRGGVHLGRPRKIGGDYYGVDVNIAARLAQAAQPGEVLFSDRTLRALDELWIEGPTTLIGFHKALLSHPCFVAAETCHGIVESAELAARAAELDVQPSVAPPGNGGLLPSAGSARTVEHIRTVEVDGRRFEVRLSEPEPAWRALARSRRERVRERRGGAGGRDAVVSPMQGTVLAVRVSEGDEVEARQVICIVEAMKMENEITAHKAGTVAELPIASTTSWPLMTSPKMVCLPFSQ